ncbi:hypothetical protein [Legionella bononiensis]|uniref:Uncharacterized protein n=1 Tax=Legionella bononiensis TaxID=2793102 RepID=A0ABS1WF93_9GAMM|nr:hypothetical protein [Legionella bononiensis]MBL7479245.1 hypothetical protein [Legionella bononiensis]MBL7528028.1 hypothetical protein [Legionella bononiensis]MBL7563895.1 hypothetical protein [Legionella bononiensis]
MTFTLTLLGTDTAYSPSHVDNAYDKAETLSYVSTMIHGVQLKQDDVTQFRNTHVAVINGPTTLGQEVGDRIARGVQAILEAMSRGEENISIIAHSRGAVEAILVAHELERIQTLLSNPDYDKSQLTNSVCKYTRAAMNGQHSAALSEIDLDKVAEHIGKAKLSILNIDPVPGGNFMVITHASSLAWRDPRFYTVPKIVSEYEQYTYENERTRCFKPIVPKCASSETKFTLNSLPGHHGTGSGNLSDQQRKLEPNGSTDHVQELVIIKIIDFLKRHDVALSPVENPDDPFAHLIAQLFPEGQYSPDFDKQVQLLYYRLYNDIIKNREAYRHFNTTSYPTLGQEQAFIKRIWNVLDQRIVHYQAHNDTYLESIVPAVPGGHFLNYEHARIHLNQELGLKDDLPLSETINQSVDRFITLCRHKKALSDLKDKPVAPENISASVVLDKFVATLDTKEGFGLLLDGLGMLIEEVRRPYLQDEFTDPNEREALYYAVQKAFVAFKELAKDPGNELAQKINEVLNTSLESTLTMKQKSLKEDYKGIAVKLKGNAFFTVLQNKIQEISTHLNEQSEGTNINEYQLDIKLKQTLKAIEELSSHNHNPQVLKSFIEQELLSYKEFAGGMELEHETAPTQNSLEWVNLVMNEALDDSINYEVENMMAEAIKVHQHLEQFRKGLPDFKALNAELDYSNWENDLEEQRDHLIRLIAQYIVKEGLDLHKDIKPLFINNDDLYAQIEGLAIGLGAVNPANIKIDQLNSEIEELQSQLRDLADQNKTLEESVIELHSVQSSLLRDNSTIQRENEVLRANISNLSVENVVLENRVQEQAQRAFKNVSVTENENRRLKELLNNDTELQCQLLVKTKLIPLTQEYLIHLATEIKQTVNPDLVINKQNLSNVIEEIHKINVWPEKESTSILKKKFDIVSGLYEHLNDQSIKKPSDKVVEFYTKLNDANEDIKQHKDPKWQRYIANTAAVLGIILTGILPGLAVLAIFSAVTGNSPKFWQSKGQSFIEKSKEEIDQNLPSIAPNKGS